MTNKNQYENGEKAVGCMKHLLEYLWAEKGLPIMLSRDIEEMNEQYQSARDAAMAFGEEVSRYPRRLRWRTDGLKILGI